MVVSMPFAVAQKDRFPHGCVFQKKKASNGRAGAPAECVAIAAQRLV